MKISSRLHRPAAWFAVAVSLVLGTALFAQDAPPGPPEGQGGPGGAKARHVRGGHGPMGKWWENPDVVSKLGLSDSQVTQLNQVFYDHKMKLIDYGADMEKQDMRLQNLLDADQPNEAQVGSQVDQVLAARSKIEREYTMMNLALRKVLTVDQWKQLKTIRGAGMPGENLMYFHKRLGPPGPGGPGELPPPPPPGEME